MLELNTMENLRVNHIRQINRFVEHAYLNDNDKKWQFFFRSYFNQLYTEIQGIYQDWFPLAKHYNDYEITEYIFQGKLERKELKTWIKYELCALINIIHQLKAQMDENYTTLPAKEQNQSQEQLQELLYEFTLFFEFAYNVVVERANKFFGQGKKSVLDAREVHTTHELHLREKSSKRESIGELNPRSAQVILLRESMKKWVKDVFGINYITDLQGNVVKLEPELLFDLIDSDKQNNEFPVDKKFIKRIYHWTTPDLQARILAYTWEIEWAKKILKPLYNPRNIRIKLDFYDNIQQLLRKTLQRDDILLHRIHRPEAIIVG